MKRIMKIMAVVMPMMMVFFFTGCEKDRIMYVEGEGGGAPIVHEYVDLGLPSGTLWATCNLGATRPEDKGSYFSWGETEAKEAYTWSTYKYCKGDYTKLTKYCYNANYGFNGFTDNLSSLQNWDDAAYWNWGYKWSIPTVEQWEELKKYTYSEWVSSNGQIGRRFRANGNSIFLPAAGGCYDGGVQEVNLYGYYWANSLYPTETYKANVFTISGASTVVGMGYGSREAGASVRPVQSK